MTPRRAGIAIGAITALTLPLAACSGGGDDGTVVTFWQFDTAQASIDAYEQAIEEFEAEHPDITIDMQIVPWADQAQQITTAVATGSLPDVSMLGNNVVAQYAASGQLANLDDYIAEWSADEGVDDITADWWPGDQSYYNVDGSWYGAPVADETRMLYYRTDLFEAAGLDPDDPPQTWDEMAEAAEALSQLDSGEVAWAAPMGQDYLTLQTFMSVYLSYGAELVNDEGMCGLETPEFYDALSYYTGLYEAGYTSPDAVNHGQTESDSLFTTGGAAMLIEGPYITATLDLENPELAENVAIAEIPAGPEGQFGFLGGWPLVMWESSDVKDAAAEWIEFATSPDGALNEIAEVSGVLPGRVSLTEEGQWTEEPWTGFATQLEDSYPYQYPADPLPEMAQIEASPIQSAVQEVATGSMSVEDATAQMCTEINEILGQ